MRDFCNQANICAPKHFWRNLMWNQALDDKLEELWKDKNGPLKDHFIIKPKALGQFVDIFKGRNSNRAPMNPEATLKRSLWLMYQIQDDVVPIWFLRPDKTMSYLMAKNGVNIGLEIEAQGSLYAITSVVPVWYADELPLKPKIDLWTVRLSQHALDRLSERWPEITGNTKVPEDLRTKAMILLAKAVEGQLSSGGVATKRLLTNGITECRYFYVGPWRVVILKEENLVLTFEHPNKRRKQ